MRLLNVNTFQLEEFHGKAPPYAILSHTWDKDEVAFDEFSTMVRSSPRLVKADRCCRVTKWFRLDYAWIDTFCINKDSSAELSESINSMYRWYQDAIICLAYLADVEGDDVGEGSFFRKSRWFTRGWTLQELLAPQNMVFLDLEWEIIGWRGIGWYNADWSMYGGAWHLYGWMEVRKVPEPRNVSRAVCQVTGIGEQYLKTHRGHMDGATVAEKMSWAAKRETTRPEDTAYSLLGIFNINMPLLYGEGGARAFLRLQEEIARRSHDLTIFAWGFGLGPTSGGAFAASPTDFAGCGQLLLKTPEIRPQRSHYTVTNLGLQTTVRYIPVGDRVCYVMLCTVSHEDEVMAIPMTRNEYQDDIFERWPGSVPVFVPSAWLAKAQFQEVYLANQPSPTVGDYDCSVSLCPVLRRRGYRIAEVYPPHAILGPMKTGKCKLDGGEEVVIIRFTDGWFLQLCAGIYNSGGCYTCRILKCDSTTTIAGLLVGAMEETHARELVRGWDRVVTLGIDDVAVEVLDRSNHKVNLPDGRSQVVAMTNVALFVLAHSGAGRA